MPTLSENFREHLRSEHQLGRFQEFLREIVYGGNDGIVTTFAVVSGFAGASATADPSEIGTIAVILFGLANLFADATSMGLGAYLSSRSQADVYHAARAKEMHEIRNNAEAEREEIFTILRTRGVPDDDIRQFADLYGRHPELLADFMMTHEIGMSDPSDSSPALEALATFVSFLVFGAIPLIPYFLREPTEGTFYLSVAATFLALVLLGLLRWKVTTRTALRAIGETVAIGGSCAVVAYAVGMLVGG